MADKRFEILLNEKLHSRLFNASYHLNEYYTLQEIVSKAIEEYVDILERKHNDGRKFPDRMDRTRRPARVKYAKKKVGSWCSLKKKKTSCVRSRGMHR